MVAYTLIFPCDCSFSLLSPTCLSESMAASAGVTCHILNKIGEGGFAVIYKAVKADNHEVAIKVSCQLQCVRYGRLCMSRTIARALPRVFCVWTQIQRPADQWEYTILNEMHRRLDEETPSVDKVRTYIVLSWYSPQLNPGHLFSHGRGLNAGTICDGAECLHHDRHVFPGAAPVLLWDLAGHH